FRPAQGSDRGSGARRDAAAARRRLIVGWPTDFAGRQSAEVEARQAAIPPAPDTGEHIAGADDHRRLPSAKGVEPQSGRALHRDGSETGFLPFELNFAAPAVLPQA